MSDPHVVYPEGPTCQPNCPGPETSYHEGYSDGYERAEKAVREFVFAEIEEAVKARMHGGVWLGENQVLDIISKEKGGA